MSDNVKNPQCEVILGISEAKKKHWGQLPSLSSVQPSEVWSVDFKISQEGTLRCEAVVQNDTLKGCLIEAMTGTKLSPRDLQIPLGNFGFDFDRIREVYESMDNPSAYDLVFNNSRTWTEKLLKTLGVAIPEITRKSARKVSLGKFKLEYQQVMEALKKMDECGEYHVVNNNCQTWVVELLAKLDIPLPRGVLTIAQEIQSVFKSKKEDEAFNEVVSDVKAALVDKDRTNIDQNMTHNN